ncbi:MAG: dioxygenase TauD/TfdA family protein [Porticoccaceae bacterium]|nr:MAG: dioxygenase TauD/TfdA family protein [Porticoccaceae bacterium]
MIHLPVEPITPRFGARIPIDRHTLLQPGVPEACLSLLDRYGVLVFPKIGVSDREQAQFSERLGVRVGSKFATPGASESDDLGIYPVTLDPERAKFVDYVKSSEQWHMDGTTYRVPPKATMLRCVVPPNEGGDTGFADLFSAFADLPAERKEALMPLRVVHSAATANLRAFPNPSVYDLKRWLDNGPPTEQPLVWRQADGRCSLVIGSTADHIVGMDLEAGRALLAELLEWCTQERYLLRHRWQEGDLVVWNNPGTLHRAYPYRADSGRLMHRTTVMGVEAFDADPVQAEEVEA